jgi:hypothetical protein
MMISVMAFTQRTRISLPSPLVQKTFVRSSGRHPHLRELLVFTHRYVDYHTYIPTPILAAI